MCKCQAPASWFFIESTLIRLLYRCVSIRVAYFILRCLSRDVATNTRPKMISKFSNNKKTRYPFISHSNFIRPTSSFHPSAFKLLSNYGHFFCYCCYSQRRYFVSHFQMFCFLFDFSENKLNARLFALFVCVYKLLVASHSSPPPHQLQVHTNCVFLLCITLKAPVF